jgi:hypothetical protein
LSARRNIQIYVDCSSKTSLGKLEVEVGSPLNGKVFDLEYCHARWNPEASLNVSAGEVLIGKHVQSLVVDLEELLPSVRDNTTLGVQVTKELGKLLANSGGRQEDSTRMGLTGAG